jgi:ABC-type sugar transport system substrate-binding protein
MTSRAKRWTAVFGCIPVAAVLVACGSTSDTASDGGGDTVAVDVGLDDPVQLRAGELSVGVFMNAMTNKYQQVLANEAKETAESFGWSAEILDFNYDQQAMSNALRSAATNHTYDAVIVGPIDGVASCDVLTRTMPESDVIVVVTSQTICDRDARPLEEMWAPGTLSFVGITTGVDYSRLFLENAVEAFPGPQKVAFVTGPPEAGISKLFEQLAEEVEEENPDFDVQDFIYTDFTAPSAFTETQNYLQANPDTTLLLSDYSPDLSQGMVQAIKAQGLTGTVKMADLGAAEYTVQQIKDGAIQLSMPLYPIEIGATAARLIKDAQDGKDPVRVPDYVPNGISQAPIVTADNVDSFTPEY